MVSIPGSHEVINFNLLVEFVARDAVIYQHHVVTSIRDSSGFYGSRNTLSKIFVPLVMATSFV